MKKFLTSLFTVLIIIGLAGTFASYKAAMVAFSGKTVNLNEATQADFSEPAKIEGEIYYVYDCVAVEEVTRTTYGIETGKDETNFYLIDTYSKAQYEEGFSGSNEPLTVLYATSNEDTIAKLDKMIEDWYAYEEAVYDVYGSATSEEELLAAIEAIEVPSETLQISGMIDEYDDMKKLNGYRDEYLGYMYEGDELTSYINDYCVDMIITTANVDTSKIIFIVTVVIAVVGLVGLIGTFVSSKKKKNEEELY